MIEARYDLDWNDWLSIHFPDGVEVKKRLLAVACGMYEVRRRVFAGIAPEEDIYRYAIRADQEYGDLLEDPALQDVLQKVATFFPRSDN